MKKTALLLLLVAAQVSTAFAQKQKPPAITLGGVPGNISRAQIIADPKLTDKNGAYTVRSFAISFFPNGRDMSGPFATKGNALTAAEIDIIKNLATPAKIIIEDIKVSGSDGAIRSLNIIELNIPE